MGYLTTTLLVTILATAAMAPPKPAASNPWNLAYILGFVINEVPFVYGFWLVASTSLAAAQGDLSTPAGLAGLGVAVGGAVALTVIARRGFVARAVLAATLEVSLPASDASAVSSIPSHHPWLRILFAPLSLRGRGVRRDGNVSYGPAGAENKLDVYYRPDAHDGPVLVYFHGGGFRSGSKNREAKPFLHRLARNGWVCISANYRVAPRTHFPGHLIDAKQAVAWARGHASEYGGDPSRIYVAGSSAGGHLATMVALSANRPEFRADGDGEDPGVLGAISLYGFYGSPTSDADIDSSPHDYLHPDAPPLLLVHGDNDTIVIVDDVRSFAQEAAAVSTNPVVYAELPGAQHGFDLLRSARFEAVVDAIEVFVARSADLDRIGG